VVEDETLIRASVADYLRDHGYRVFEADSVSEATSILGNGTPVDLVFTDVNLVGDENGFMLARWVHQHSPATKVLLTSGTANADEVRGDDPIMMKPYGYSGVVRWIQGLLPPSP
jgi:DNA-binding response OmpR family regulator